MPRMNTNNQKRGANLEDWEEYDKILGAIARMCAENGAYVGMFYNAGYGFNFQIMYENDKERFYASHPQDVALVLEEVHEYLVELNTKWKDKPKQTRHKKP